MRVGELHDRLRSQYAWLESSLESTTHEDHYFWYYSREKFEPRLGVRSETPGAELEMPLAIAQQVRALGDALGKQPRDRALAAFLLEAPQWRQIAHRVQVTADHEYAEIRANLIGRDMRPIDMLRFKLALFGASKFDPKSALWTRIALFQGAPCPDQLDAADPDDWAFPVLSL